MRGGLVGMQATLSHQSQHVGFKGKAMGGGAYRVGGALAPRSMGPWTWGRNGGSRIPTLGWQ